MLGTGSPSAVRFFVIAIWVDAVEGHSRWSRSHVCQEILKLFPPFADGDATTSVVFESGISAAGKHGLPANILRRLCANVASVADVRAKRLGKGLLKRPALVKPCYQGGSSKAGFFCPVLDGKRLPVKSYEHVPATVSILDAARGPSAILLKVSKVVVDAVQAVLWRARSHVFIKTLKIPPAFTYRDTASAVVSIIRRVFVETAREHIAPCFIFFRTTGAWTLTMRSKLECIKSIWYSTRQVFCFQASATFSQASNKTIAERREYIPTVASAPPAYLTIFINPVEFNHSRVIESLTCKVGSVPSFAAATLRLSISERIAVDGRDATADTVAEPLRLFAIVEPIKREHGEITECLSDHVFEHCHGGILT